MKTVCHSLIAAISISCVVSPSLASESWPRWRGMHDRGSAIGSLYPTQLNEQTLVWKVALPGKGCSTPVVWNQRIFVTGPSKGLDAVMAFDWSGKPLWTATFGPEDPGKHRNASGSNPSPVTDGRQVFVYFKSGTLAALSLDGKIQWQTNLVAAYGPANLYWDFGTSPVLSERFVVMAKMHEGDSWIVAFDKATGALVWKTPRNYKTPNEGDHGYTTPLLIDHNGREAILAWGGLHLTAHDVADGKLLWSCGDFNPQQSSMWAAVANPIVIGDMVVVPTGRNDRNQPRLHGIRLGGSGDVTKSHRAWKREDTGTFVPTPAAFNGYAYLLRDRGEVECLDPLTGKTLWAAALPRDRANYYSSPVIAGGILYAVREDGAAFVAKVDGKFELLSESKLGERVIASPVAVGNRVLVRGEKHLHSFGVRTK